MSELIQREGGVVNVLGGPEVRKLQALCKAAPDLQKAAKDPATYTAKEQRLVAALQDGTEFAEIMRIGEFDTVETAVDFLLKLAPESMTAYTVACFVADQKASEPASVANLADMVTDAASGRVV